MKFQAILFSTLCLVTNAFGVQPAVVGGSKKVLLKKSPSTSSSSVFHKTNAVASRSPLFRDPSLTRGGAVPGWAAYNQALEDKPILTKALTSLTGFALADALTQLFISKGPFDMKRWVILSMFGLLYHGPSGHYFYNWLDNLIKGAGPIQVASKVAFDQIFWCPVFMTVYFSYLGLCAGDSFAVIGNKIKSDLFTAVQGSWKVWPFVHAVNFAFISTKHRLVFINTVQVAFNMFLSIIGNK